MIKNKKPTILIAVFVLLSVVFETSAQEKKGLQHILGKLAVYTENNPPEKVYVQTDKDLYTNGETIWLKAYVLDGTRHTASTLSRIVYVELVDSKDTIITRQKLYVESF